MAKSPLARHPLDHEDVLQHAMLLDKAKPFGSEVHYLDLSLGGAHPLKLRQLKLSDRVKGNQTVVAEFPSGGNAVSRGFSRLNQHLIDNPQQPLVVRNPIGFPSFDFFFLEPRGNEPGFTVVPLMVSQTRVKSTRDLTAARDRISAWKHSLGVPFSTPLVWEDFFIHLCPYKNIPRSLSPELVPDVKQSYCRIEYDPSPAGAARFVAQSELLLKRCRALPWAVIPEKKEAETTEAKTTEAETTTSQNKDKAKTTEAKTTTSQNNKDKAKTTTSQNKKDKAKTTTSQNNKHL